MSFLTARMPLRLALLIATCAAIHPVFRWAALRTWDGSDEPYGIVALLAVVALVLERRGTASRPRNGISLPETALPHDGISLVAPSRPRNGISLPETALHRDDISLVAPALCLGVYAATYPFLTPLPRSMIAITALSLLLSRLYFGSNLNLGLLGLLQLALPMIASIQFYLGYPLRLLVAQATAGLLRCGGFDVSVVGVGLELGERSILVDAPCSGIKMLWAGAFVTCLLAAHYRLRVRESLVYMTSAAVCILAANVLRAAALFYVELRLLSLPASAHELIGLMMFGVALAAIAVLGRSRTPIRYAVNWTQVFSALGLDFVRARPVWRREFVPRSERKKLRAVHAVSGIRCYVALLVLVALLPMIAPKVHHPVANAPPFPGWPELEPGKALPTLPLTDTEIGFAQSFPGKIGKFGDTRHSYVVRWVTTPTRRLHPAEDCYRASGFTIHHEARCPAEVSDGSGCFTAVRNGATLVVQERITDGDGKTFSDVSAWYWAAMRGATRGPWWSVTKVTAL